MFNSSFALVVCRSAHVLFLLSYVVTFLVPYSVLLYLQLFVGGLMSYLPYLCLFVYSGVQHILCCVFVMFVFVLFTLCCQFLWIVHFWLPLRYSLTFIKLVFLLSSLWPSNLHKLLAILSLFILDDVDQRH